MKILGAKKWEIVFSAFLIFTSYKVKTDDVNLVIMILPDADVDPNCVYKF
ncbi:hypothetical protein LCGC14_1260380 [marine sediment metagenome]|uniref:Uncharacterized protein n=1 Tax=marine sediment metagenome TaxID=412755 RepID=A0A0F9L0Y3_9ZZZZ